MYFGCLNSKNKLYVLDSCVRYLGFRVLTTKNGKQTTIKKGKQVRGLRVVIRNEAKVVFDDTVQNCFRNGVFYVQDIRLDHAGLHHVQVEVVGEVATQVAPLQLSCHVYEFMELQDSAELAKGPYAPLRSFVHSCLQRHTQDQLRQDAFVDAFVQSKKHALRTVDAKVRVWAVT